MARTVKGNEKKNLFKRYQEFKKEKKRIIRNLKKFSYDYLEGKIEEFANNIEINELGNNMEIGELRERIVSPSMNSRDSVVSRTESVVDSARKRYSDIRVASPVSNFTEGIKKRFSLDSKDFGENSSRVIKTFEKKNFFKLSDLLKMRKPVLDNRYYVGKTISSAIDAFYSNVEVYNLRKLEDEQFSIKPNDLEKINKAKLNMKLYIKNIITAINNLDSTNSNKGNCISNLENALEEKRYFTKKQLEAIKNNSLNPINSEVFFNNIKNRIHPSDFYFNIHNSNQKKTINRPELNKFSTMSNKGKERETYIPNSSKLRIAPKSPESTPSNTNTVGYNEPFDPNAPSTSTQHIRLN